MSGFILDELNMIRDELYESLPTGYIKPFDLIKAIKSHIEKLDKIVNRYSKVNQDTKDKEQGK